MAMDQDARERFAFFASSMSNAASQYELWEARRAAEAIAREHGLTFDAALREHRSPAAMADEDGGEDDQDEEDDDSDELEPAESAHQRPFSEDADDEDADNPADHEERPLAPVEAASATNAWDEPISAYVADRSTVTIGEIATTALGLAGRLATTDRLRISACLERLGWARGRKDWKGRISWARPTTDHPDAT